MWAEFRIPYALFQGLARMAEPRSKLRDGKPS